MGAGRVEGTELFCSRALLRGSTDLTMGVEGPAVGFRLLFLAGADEACEAIGLEKRSAEQDSAKYMRMEWDAEVDVSSLALSDGDEPQR